MGSPVPLFIIFGVYLWFVLKAGPQFMKDRKPFKLTQIVRVYNVFQVIACASYVTKMIKLKCTLDLIWKCSYGTIIGTEEEAYVVVWYLILLRLLELIETVFFVLRKKQNQVTALHVYHHISTVFIIWMFLKYSGGK